MLETTSTRQTNFHHAYTSRGAGQIARGRLQRRRGAYLRRRSGGRGEKENGRGPNSEMVRSEQVENVRFHAVSGWNSAECRFQFRSKHAWQATRTGYTRTHIPTHPPAYQCVKQMRHTETPLETVGIAPIRSLDECDATQRHAAVAYLRAEEGGVVAQLHAMWTGAQRGASMAIGAATCEHCK